MLGQIDSQYLKLSPKKALKRWLSYIFFEGRPYASRLRILNSITIPFLNLVSNIHIKNTNIEKPIFIVGMGRSGSTFLGRVLSLHKEIGFLNEGIGLWHAIIPHGDIFANFTSLNEALNSKFRFTERDVTREVCEKAYNLINFYLKLNQTKRYLDKHSVFTFRIPFLKALFPDAKFIFLVRNGWYVCNSIKKWNTKNRKEVNGKIVDWWGINQIKWKLLLNEILKDDEDLRSLYEYISNNIKDDFNMAVVEYILTNKEGLFWLNEYKHDFCVIKYEGLIRNIDEELSNIIKFLELEEDGKVFSYAKIHTQKTGVLGKIDTDQLNGRLKPFFYKMLDLLGY